MSAPYVMSQLLAHLTVLSHCLKSPCPRARLAKWHVRATLVSLLAREFFSTLPGSTACGYVLGAVYFESRSQSSVLSPTGSFYTSASQNVSPKVIKTNASSNVFMRRINVVDSGDTADLWTKIKLIDRNQRGKRSKDIAICLLLLQRKQTV